MLNDFNTFTPGYRVFYGELTLNKRVYRDMFSNYLLEEGFVEEELPIITSYSNYLNKKKTGLDYKGTLITFTKEDTDGINHIYNVIKNEAVDVYETTFITSIRTSITLNKDNIDEFYNWFCVNRNKFFITYEEYKLGVYDGTNIG